ncbi:MAG TPA: hypothetical protein VFY75_02610 [Solirubrobacterales bacterium]|nr:hypothetical protein [Solirubrobacterales bacterium]
MSTFVYGALTAKRERAPTKKSKKEKPPGFGSYTDVLAALVPAEVLAINALLMSLVVSSSNAENGNVVTQITDTGGAQLIFWLSLVACVAIYFVGAKSGEGGLLKNWNWLRALIPAVAYVGWTMIQKSTAFDAVAPDMSEASRVIVAVFVAFFIGAIAKRLSDKADEVDPGA